MASFTLDTSRERADTEIIVDSDDDAGLSSPRSARGTATSIDSIYESDYQSNLDEDEFMDARQHSPSMDESGVGVGSRLRHSVDDLSGLMDSSLLGAMSVAETTPEMNAEAEAKPVAPNLVTAPEPVQTEDTTTIEAVKPRQRNESDLLREEVLPEGQFYLTKINDEGEKYRILVHTNDNGDIVPLDKTNQAGDSDHLKRDEAEDRDAAPVDAVRGGGHSRADTAEDVLGNVDEIVRQINENKDGFAAFSRNMTKDGSRPSGSQAASKPSAVGGHGTDRAARSGLWSRLRRKSAYHSDLDANVTPVKMYKRKAAEYTGLYLRQELRGHKGYLFTMQLSEPDLNDKIVRPLYLATAGQDKKICIWEIANDGAESAGKVLPEQASASATAESRVYPKPHPSEKPAFKAKPFRVFEGHEQWVCSLAWNKGFLLSASLDRTVRLWHVDKKKCLQKYPHPSAVTCVAFHPTNVGRFVTGCSDCKIRVYNITKNRVVQFQQTPHKISAISYSPDGKLVVVGLYNGACIFYIENNLHFHTQIECRNRRNKLKSGVGKKVTGFSWRKDGQELLVTTSDSRVRLYRIRDYNPLMKLKGAKVEQTLIITSFNESGTKVIGGSEDGRVVIWFTDDSSKKGKRSFDFNRFSNKNYAYESFVGTDSVSFCAMFGPSLMAEQIGRTESGVLLRDTKSNEGTTNVTNDSRFVLVGDSKGVVRIFEQRARGL